MARSSSKVAMVTGDVISPVDGTLEFDDDTLRAIAKVYLHEGDSEYNKNELGNATHFFTEGIKANCKDVELNAKLYSNRATAYFYLGKYQEALNDAQAAIKLEPTLIKAIEIGASACVQLQLYDEAITLCDKGLAINDSSNTLLQLKTRSLRNQSELQETPLEKPKDHTIKGQENGNYTNAQDRKKEGRKYFDLGNASYRVGDFKKAIEYHELHLTIARELGDREGEGKSYCNIGNAYESQGDFKRAMEYQERYLRIAKEIEDKDGEGSAYCNLGNCCYRQGNIKKAMYNYERSLQIAKEEKDKVGEGRAYCNLGNVYYRLGNCRKAIDYQESNLKICKELEDKDGEGKAYCNLGNAYYSLGDFKKALDYHERCLKIAIELEDKVGEGRAYCNIGNACFSLGNLKKAIDYHELHLKMAKTMEARAGEGMAYANLGNAYYSLGDYKQAIFYHERHLNIAKGMGDRVGQGKSFCNLGNAYYSLGNCNKAIDYHERHLKIARETEDRPGEGRAYGNLGNVYFSLGDFNKAIEFHKRHVKVAKDVEDRVGEGRAYGNLGNSFSALGDFKKAIDYHERDLLIAKEVGDIAGEGGAYGGLGLAYDSLGDFKTAIDFHERHLNIAKEVKDKAGEGWAYANLANAYGSLENYEKAIEYHERHLKLAKEIEDRAGEGKAYGNLGNAYHQLGNFMKAIDYHERHLKIAKELKDRAGEGKAYGNLGNAFSSLWNFKMAIDYHEHHLKIAKEVGDKAGEAKAFYGLGQNFELQGSPLEALQSYRSSVRIFNDVRDSLRFKDEWKISFRNMYQTVYTSLWRLLLKQDKVVEALLAAEQGRAQALKDMMAFNYGLEAAYVKSKSPDKTAYDSLKSLPPNTVFIAIGQQEIVLWVIQNGKDVELRRKTLRDNSPEDINNFWQSLLQSAREEMGVRAGVKCEDRSLDKMRDETWSKETRSPQIQSRPVHLQRNALRTFYDVIIGPIADLVQGNELRLVPEGPLCLAPYAAFMCPNARYLCESFRIRVIPSLTSLKLIVDCPSDYHSKTGVLLVGDPWVQEIVCQGKILEQLPWARIEVEEIGRILHTAPLIGREATKSEVLKRLSSVALVHIAAHGRMETGEIALAPNYKRKSQNLVEEDFLLTMKDVMSVQLRARLVVLSCCHSGCGEIKAEGVVGIARAFLGAGARSVLVSLWAIDDEATLEFMKSFYLHLTKGRSASEALNQAMKCMRLSQEFNQVKFWAPFVLMGDDVTLEFAGSVLS